MSANRWPWRSIGRVGTGVAFLGWLLGACGSPAAEAERAKAETEVRPERRESGEARAPADRGERAVRADRPRADANADLAAMERRLEELKGRVRALAAEGRRDEAEAMEIEARDVARNLERARAERREAVAGRARSVEPEREGREPPAGRAEAEQRLRHLRAAAENLAAAGMEDAARRIMEEAEAAERRFRSPEGARPDVRPAVPAEALQRHVEELTRAVQDLRRDLEALRAEVRELRRRPE